MGPPSPHVIDLTLSDQEDGNRTPPISPGLSSLPLKDPCQIKQEEDGEMMEMARPKAVPATEAAAKTTKTPPSRCVSSDSSKEGGESSDVDWSDAFAKFGGKDPQNEEQAIEGDKQTRTTLSPDKLNESSTAPSSSQETCSCDGCLRKPCGQCRFCKEGEGRCVFGLCRQETHTNEHLIQCQQYAATAVREAPGLQRVYDTMFAKPTGWVHVRIHLTELVPTNASAEKSSAEQPAKPSSSSGTKDKTLGPKHQHGQPEEEAKTGWSPEERLSKPAATTATKRPTSRGMNENDAISVESSSPSPKPKLIQRRVYQGRRHFTKLIATKTTLSPSPGRTMTKPLLIDDDSDDDEDVPKKQDGAAGTETSDAEKTEEMHVDREQRPDSDNNAAAGAEGEEKGLSSKEKDGRDDDDDDAMSIGEGHGRPAELVCLPVTTATTTTTENGPPSGSSDDEAMLSAREHEDDDEMHWAQEPEVVSTTTGTDTEYESAVGSPVYESAVSSVATKPTKATTLAGRAYRCRVCQGCRQSSCGLCNRCQRSNIDNTRTTYGRPCCFRPCERFAAGTLLAYRMDANVCTKRLRDENGKSPLDELHEKYYGPHGWATQLGSGGGNDKALPDHQNQQQLSDTEAQPVVADEEQCDKEPDPAEEQQSDTVTQKMAAEPTDTPGGKAGRYTKHRCGECDGCQRDKCGRCSSCHTYCVFKACSKYSYSPSTLHSYMRIAKAACRENRNDDVLQAAFKAAYGTEGWATKVLESKNVAIPTPGSPPKKSAHHGRCGSCDGCSRDKCGLCPSCKGRSGHCVFNVCSNFSYATSTLTNYRTIADVARRENPDSSEIKELHEEIYGKQGLVTRLVDKKRVGGAVGGEKKTRAGGLCGMCDNCVREKCGLCPSCKGTAKGTRGCAFKICLNYLYATATVESYRKLADDAVDENEDSCAVRKLYEEVYGTQGLVTKLHGGGGGESLGDKGATVTGGKSPKKARGVRCGTCTGCLREKCEVCSSCQGRSTSSGCVFKLCCNYAYAATTLNTYRKMAKEAVRKNGHSETIRELYAELYGDQDVAGGISQDSGEEANTKEESSKRSKGKPSRSSRCGACDGCNAPHCGHCSGCRREGPSSRPCGFKPCRSYEITTLRNYRHSAANTVQRLLDKNGKSPLDDRYEHLYGERGWVTKAIDASDSHGSSKPRSSPGSARQPESKISSPSAPLQPGTKKSRPGRCGTCVECTRKRCGCCRSCRGRGNGNNTSCAFRLCRNASYALSTLGTYRTFARDALSDEEADRDLIESMFEEMYGKRGWATKRCEEIKANTTCQIDNPQTKTAGHNGKLVSYRATKVCTGDRVYCMWPANNAWYWGKILSTGDESGCEVYHVRFDDGDERFNVPPDDFVTSQEYEDSESDKRPEKKRKRKPLQVSASSQANVEKFASNTESMRSRDLRIGSRCFAKFDNGWWYWGIVTNVTGSERARMFSVKFDDGDQLDGIASYSIVSGREYHEVNGENPPPAPGDPSRKRKKSDQKQVRRLSTLDLRAKCCGKCVMCSKEDCGSCETCRTNRRQTSTAKECCLHKMCSALSFEQKQQPISGLLSGWKYYFVDPDTLPNQLRQTEPAHPSLPGLIIVSSSGDEHRTILDAAKASGDTENLSDDVFFEATAEFYEQKLGVSMMVEKNHDLLRKGYHRKWRDYRGEVKEVYGRITKCKESLLKPTWHFTVTYDADSCGLLKPFGLVNDADIPAETDQVEEADAWGGYCSFAEVTGTTISLTPVPFHRKYIVPITRREDRYSSNGLPVLKFHVRGFKLELEARQSGIPNAGLGLWLTCTPLSPMMKRKYFELQAGELVDIGVYAPLQSDDCKHDHISLLKNFIFCWKIEGWNYDSIPFTRGAPVWADVFDITDDETGDLHEHARKNIVVYTNETDGKETPTIWANHDPEGSVHYNLGHAESHDKPFRIRADGQPVELKIDYGPRYESVRVKKGYSRLKGRELEAKRKTLLEEHREMIREFQEYSVREIKESTEFLMKVFESSSPWEVEEIRTLVRSLAASIALQQRLIEICHKFDSFGQGNDDDDDDNLTVCDNGYSTMENDGTISKLRDLIHRLCTLFPHGDNQMDSELLAEPLYRTLLTQSLGLTDTNDLYKLGEGELRSRLEAFSTQLIDRSPIAAAVMEMD